MTSINAYYELKEEGKISERQELALMTVRKFYEEYDYWPTAKEVHVFLAIEEQNKMAQIEGPNFIKPRITELITDPDDEYPDLLEKKSMSREQAYIERQVDEYDSTRKAKPVKIAEEHLDHHSSDTPEEEEGEEEPDIEEDEDDTDQDLDSGDVIFGSEDDEDEEDSDSDDNASSEEGGEEEPVSIDGTEYTKDGDLWVSEDGEDYVFPPGKDEDDYDLDEYGDRSEPSDENQDMDQEKEEKEASLNQYQG